MAPVTVTIKNPWLRCTVERSDIKKCDSHEKEEEVTVIDADRY
jgi:hypothetical protein